MFKHKAGLLIGLTVLVSSNVALAGDPPVHVQLTVDTINGTSGVVQLEAGVRVVSNGVDAPALSAEIDRAAIVDDLFCMDGAGADGLELELIDRNNITRMLRGVTRIEYDGGAPSMITMTSNQNLICFDRSALPTLENGQAECADSDRLLATGFELNENFAGLAVGVRPIGSNESRIDYEVSLINCGSETVNDIALRDYFSADELLISGSGRWGACTGPCDATDMSLIQNSGEQRYLMRTPENSNGPRRALSIEPGETKYFGVRRLFAEAQPVSAKVSVVAINGLGMVDTPSFESGTFDLLAVEPPVLTLADPQDTLTFEMNEDSGVNDLGIRFVATDPNPLDEANPFPNCSVEDCFVITRVSDSGAVINPGNIDASYDPQSGTVSVTARPRPDRYGDGLLYSIAILDEEGATSNAFTMSFDVLNVNDPPQFDVAAGFDRSVAKAAANLLQLNGNNNPCTTTLVAGQDGYVVTPQGCSLEHRWGINPLQSKYLLLYSNFLTNINAGVLESETICVGSTCNMDCLVHADPGGPGDQMFMCDDASPVNPAGLFESIGATYEDGVVNLSYTLARNGNTIPGGNSDIVLTFYDGTAGPTGNTTVRIPVAVDRLPPILSLPTQFSGSFPEQSLTADIVQVQFEDAEGGTTASMWEILNEPAIDRNSNGTPAVMIGADGTLSVTDFDDLDFETYGGSIVITVEATDAFNARSTMDVNLIIDDIDDTAPVISGSLIPVDITNDENRIVVLNGNHLNASDVDTADPAELIYEVLTQVDEGWLQLNNGGWNDLLTLDTFTQADVNAGNIRFRQTCRQDPFIPFDNLNLRLSDAAGNIMLVPARLDVSFSSAAEVTVCD